MATDSPCPDQNEAEGDREDGLEEITVDDIQAYLDAESQKRLWLRAIIPLLQLRSHDTDPSGRVQLAFDLMHIAACERVARILNEDIAQAAP
jgi:hypothetical protein